MATVARDTEVRSGPARWLWFTGGLVCVACGAIGVVVPGWPTTVFFILAASAFARSSPRFERWVLELPKIGPLVRDYRAGLGMPRRAKAWSVGTMLVVATLSVVFAIDHPVAIGAVITLVAVGCWFVLSRVPTRERVLAERDA